LLVSHSELLEKKYLDGLHKELDQQKKNISSLSCDKVEKHFITPRIFLTFDCILKIIFDNVKTKIESYSKEIVELNKESNKLNSILEEERKSSQKINEEYKDLKGYSQELIKLIKHKDLLERKLDGLQNEEKRLKTDFHSEVLNLTGKFENEITQNNNLASFNILDEEKSLKPREYLINIYKK
jgi:hypothetical protein